MVKFQSTLHIRGANAFAECAYFLSIISIHAPHTGSDKHRLLPISKPLYFNPRSPYGERPAMSDATLCGVKFQSTLPIRGATSWLISDGREGRISIHAPHTGSDGNVRHIRRFAEISIHAPHTGSDHKTPDFNDFLKISIHAPHTGSDPGL